MNHTKKLNHGMRLNANLFERSASMSNETWRIFRIMSEFVDGFESLWHVRHAIAMFGSARATPDDEIYQSASAIACGLGHLGFSVITGGGPGVMQAANKGSFESPAESIGLNIDLPHEQESNPFLDTGLDFRYFFVRKVMFVKFSAGFVMMPGGYGTLDELFEVLTLIQTKKIERVPIVFYNSEFWKGLVHWLKGELLAQELVDEKDLKIFKILDTPSEVVEYFQEYYHLFE